MISEKFQLCDPAQITNRELLVNALDTAMTNDAERDGLAWYKGKVAALNTDQAKLEETKQRISEQRKAGEKDNRGELIKLRNNAATLEKRIQRACGKLLMCVLRHEALGDASENSIDAKKIPLCSDIFFASM